MRELGIRLRKFWRGITTHNMQPRYVRARRWAYIEGQERDVSSTGYFIAALHQLEIEKAATAGGTPVEI